jgi:hypothetical protein
VVQGKIAGVPCDAGGAGGRAVLQVVQGKFAGVP